MFQLLSKARTLPLVSVKIFPFTQNKHFLSVSELFNLVKDQLWNKWVHFERMEQVLRIFLSLSVWLRGSHLGWQKRSVTSGLSQPGSEAKISAPDQKPQQILSFSAQWPGCGESNSPWTALNYPICASGLKLKTFLEKVGTNMNTLQDVSLREIEGDVIQPKPRLLAVLFL